jgi:hypothetical protein
MTDPMKQRDASFWVGLRRGLASKSGDRFSARYNGRRKPEAEEVTLSIPYLRHSLRTMPAPTAPSDLRTKLRVIASRESQRAKAQVSWKARWNYHTLDFRLWLNNLMRPLAIPTAGGFVSAVALFGILVPSLAVPGVVARANDVPTMLYTEASVKHFMPIGFEAEDLVVEITVDEQGRMMDYSIPNCADKSQHVHRSIENQILFTEFTPARSFGQKISGGKVKITFTSSHIDVKG